MPEQTSPLIVVISGPSGVGKDAVLERMKRSPQGRHFVITATTRPMRPDERDGVDYMFLTSQDFEELLARDELLEHALVYGRYYGVPRKQVEDALAAGKDVIVKTDIQGARALKAKMPGPLLIFLAPPDMRELERRLMERKSEATEERRRMETAYREMECQHEFDYVVVNHNGHLEEAVAEIEKLIAAEKRRRGQASAEQQRPGTRRED